MDGHLRRSHSRHRKPEGRIPAARPGAAAKDVAQSIANLEGPSLGQRGAASPLPAPSSTQGNHTGGAASTPALPLAEAEPGGGASEATLQDSLKMATPEVRGTLVFIRP